MKNGKALSRTFCVPKRYYIDDGRYHTQQKESIERCVKQIQAYYGKPSELPFEEDFFKQDAIAINIQRASEQCIDLANHIVKLKKAWNTERE